MGKLEPTFLIEKFNQSMTTASDLQRIQRNTQTLLNPFEPEEDFNIVLHLPKNSKSGVVRHNEHNQSILVQV